jgi:Fe-S oxidoreductase
MEENEGQRVNVNRTNEILDAKVDAVAVACPFCNIMLTDGMKSANMEAKVQVLDIAELVAQSIAATQGVDVPLSNLVRKRDR